MEAYRIVLDIGGGGQGKTAVAVSLESGTEVVIKSVPCDSIKQGNAALREAKVLQSFKHPAIVRYLDVFIDQEEGGGGGMLVCTVMELCKGGDLAVRLRNDAATDNPPDESLARRWLSQLAGGVSSLHSRGMVHRDIKPQNVLITCDDRLKLGDFGLASEKSSGGGRVGTPAYLSPEVLIGTEETDEGVDLWGLGCVSFEMMTMSWLVDRDVLLGVEVVTSPVGARNLPPRFSPLLRRLASALLSASPDDRPRADDVETECIQSIPEVVSLSMRDSTSALARARTGSAPLARRPASIPRNPPSEGVESPAPTGARRGGDVGWFDSFATSVKAQLNAIVGKGNAASSDALEKGNSDTEDEWMELRRRETARESRTRHEGDVHGDFDDGVAGGLGGLGGGGVGESVRVGGGSRLDDGNISRVGGHKSNAASAARAALHYEEAKRLEDDEIRASSLSAAAASSHRRAGSNSGSSSSNAREGRQHRDERHDRPPPISPSYSERGSSSPSSRSSSSISRSSRSEGLPPPMSPSYVGASPRSLRSSGTSGYGSSCSSRSGSPCPSPMQISSLVQASGTTITVDEKWVVTSSQPVKVRSEPSLKGEVIGELPHGDIIDVCSRTDRRGGWVQTASHQGGWIRCKDGKRTLLALVARPVAADEAETMLSTNTRRRGGRLWFVSEAGGARVCAGPRRSSGVVGSLPCGKVIVASGYRGEDGGWVRLQNWGHPVLGEGWVQCTEGGTQVLTCMDEDYTANGAGGECWVVVGKGAKVRLGPSHLSAPLAPLVPGGIVRVSAGYALDGGWACLSDIVKSSDGTSHRDGWVCVRGAAGEAFLRPFAYQMTLGTYEVCQDMVVKVRTGPCVKAGKMAVLQHPDRVRVCGRVDFGGGWLEVGEGPMAGGWIRETNGRTKVYMGRVAG